jgi:hypothetical protein
VKNVVDGVFFVVLRASVLAVEDFPLFRNLFFGWTTFQHVQVSMDQRHTGKAKYDFNLWRDWVT